MTHLPTIIRATRRSANALDSMSHFARIASDAAAVIARNHARVANGFLKQEVAEIGNRIARAQYDHAMRAHKRACGTFKRAQEILARNPL
jgi:hypothetical protein